MYKVRQGVTFLPLILLVAILLRLTFGFTYQHRFSHQALGAISFLFEPGNIAASLASGKGYHSPFRVETGPTAWSPPVYPALLAIVFRFFGAYTYSSYVVASSLNIVFSVLTAVPLFYMGKGMFGIHTGALAAWLWALFPNAMIIPVQLMWDTSLTTLFAATILWMTIRLAGAIKPVEWFFYGLLWGLALLTNATLLSLAPFLIGWLIYRVEPKSRVWLAVCALGALLLCCLPWTIRNYLVFHTFIPFRTGLGVQLWIGNNARAQSPIIGKLHPIDNSAEREKYIEMGEVAYDRDKLREAVSFMVANPKLETGWTIERFIATWSGGTITPFTDLFNAPSVWTRLVIASNLFLSLGALAGMVTLVRMRNTFLWPVASFPVIFPVFLYLSAAFARYRHPIDPALVLLTAAAFTLLRQPLKKTSYLANGAAR